MKNTMKRWISALLALVLVLGCGPVPIRVHAEECEHAFEVGFYNQGDADGHYNECDFCIYFDPASKAPHTYPEGSYYCEVCSYNSCPGHTYDDDSDLFCSLCGYNRCTHNGDYAWDEETYDEYDHLLVCPICKAYGMWEAHKDDDGDDQCDVCGYDMTDSGDGDPEHTHTYENGSYHYEDGDLTGHYPECDECDYYDEDSKEPHTDTADSDGYCDLCGCWLVQYFDITIAATENGSVTADPTTAPEGDTVTLTVTPDEGFALDTLTVTSGTQTIETTGENGTYSFTMPAGSVTVTAAFEEAESRIIYFDIRKTSWNIINIYFWSDSDTTMTTWPGEAMELVEGTVYSYAIPKAAEYVIFNNGSKQTVDLSVPADGTDCFIVDRNKDAANGNYDGNWYSYPCTHANKAYSNTYDGNHAVICADCLTELGQQPHSVAAGTNVCTDCEAVFEAALNGVYRKYFSDSYANAKQGDTITVLQSVTVDKDVGIATGITMVIRDGVTLTVSEMTNYGTIRLEGSGTVVVPDEKGTCLEDGSNHTWKDGKCVVCHTECTHTYGGDGVTCTICGVSFYKLWVGGIQVTSVNASNVLGTGTVTYDASTNTLTLNGATINGVVDKYEGAGICYMGSFDGTDTLNIKLVGQNTVNASYVSSGWSTAVKVSGANLNISGPGGTLNAISNVTADIYGSAGIKVEPGNLTIESGTINASSSNAATYVYGISAEGGTVTITGGEVNATGAEVGDGPSSGIHGSGGVSISNAKVTATGGKSEKGDSTGIYSGDDLTISGTADITANGAEGDNSAGIGAQGAVTISGGTINATGADAAKDSHGIGALGNVTISGGSVTATAGKAGNYSLGIGAEGDLTMEGSLSLNASGEDCAVGAVKDIGLTGDHKITANGANEYTNADSIDWLTTTVLKVESAYCITFDANGGAWGTDTTKQIFLYPGDQLTLPANPAKAMDGCTAYTFTGWSTGTDGDTVQISPDVTASATYYAIYTSSESHIDANDDHLCDRNCGTTVSRHDVGADGKCTICKTQFVAKVTAADTAYYTTLQAAVDAVSSGTATDTVVTLLTNVDLGDSTVWAESGTFTLDLGGKTLTSSTDTLYVGGANVTVKNGMIQGDYGISISSGGSVTVETGVVITGANRGVALYSGSLTVNSGTISASAAGSYGIDAEPGTTVTVTGGEISGQGSGIFSAGALNISGGTITGVDGFAIQSDGTTTISGQPELSGGDTDILYYRGTVDLSGYTGESCTLRSLADEADTGSLTLPEGWVVYDSDKQIVEGALTYYRIYTLRAKHAHSFAYTADGATITATCADSDGFCPDPEQTITISAEGKTYDGTPVTASLTGAIEGETTPTIIYSGNTDAGTYTASITVAGKTAGAEFTIGKADGTASVTLAGWTYGEESNDPAITSSTNGIDSCTVSYKVKGAEDSTYTSEKPVDAGSYTVRVEIGETKNYKAVTATADFTIGKAPLTVTANAAGKTYGDSDPELTYTVSGLLSGDAMSGALTRAAGENVGTYAITQGTLTAGGNYTITYTGASLNIDPKPITEQDVKLNGSLAYTGSEQTQEVTVTEGITYTVTGNKATDVGAYELTVTASGNHTGTVKLAWTIKASAAAVTAAPTAKELTYTGEAQNLVTAGTAQGGKLVYSLEKDGAYSETIPTGMAPGEYTVWYYVQGDGNHADSAKTSVTVTIAKAEQTITVDTSDRTASCGETLKARTVSAQGTITYESSDPSVASVNAKTGKIKAKKAGTVTITIRAAETETHQAASVSCTLTVSHSYGAAWNPTAQTTGTNVPAAARRTLLAMFPARVISAPRTGSAPSAAMLSQRRPDTATRTNGIPSAISAARPVSWRSRPSPSTACTIPAPASTSTPAAPRSGIP